MPKKEVLKDMMREVVEEVLAENKKGHNVPGEETGKEKVTPVKVDLSNAELLERLEAKEKARKEKEDAQCGACGEVFKGELPVCPKCGKKLTW